MDPIHQFAVQPFVPFHLFGLDVSFTNASLFMLLVVGVVSIVMLIGTSQRSIVPGRLQSAAEMSYEFVASTVKMSAGTEGMKFFPLIFTVFMFILACNLLGLLPFSFSITSQLVITFALAIVVILVVLAVGFSRHGLHFLKLFVPSGVTIWLLPFIVVIEVISFLIRPITLSVRLFANMLAGHITLKVMAGFVAALLGAGVATWIVAPLPFLANVVLLGFELFVAVLQAYIFTILSCVYLNDAFHPGH
ncbi:F0F1 ATP synthase subunit A [uncultured Methylovirgula sp.]|uniref:F0F1 ATP synthase subunit A n=1 Tax=uncultured Methylovirgula sp. TaxID=1285960 RepID=UPI00260E924B|nr:F0F1 ATP synthase subunit A [uncultured Methylovirgula sp.]